MTTFNPGDRVQYNAIDDFASREHNDLGVVTAVPDSNTARVRWDNGNLRENCIDYLVLVAPPNTCPLVGPAPKDNAPKIVAPFTYDDSTNDLVDAKGNTVGGVFPVGLSPEDTHEFGRYVRDALNARVFCED